MDVRVDFERLAWESPSPGIRFKVFRRGGRQLRLLEFSEGFEEEEWCTRAHAFHVLEGELTLRLRDDRTVRMKAGDVGFLEGGAGHKAILGRGERARLLMFEEVS